MQDDDLNDDDEAQSRANYALVFASFAAVFLLAIALILLRSDKPQGFTAKPETPRQTYVNILGETHTGLRFVRLDDYITTLASNDNTNRAKTARDALATHEQMAWAKLTDALYDLNLSPSQKLDALSNYERHWGRWSRQEELPKLLAATIGADISSINTQYAPNARRSKFRKDTQETTLAGALPSAVIVDPPIKNTRTKSTDKTVQNVRIKYAKRPRYPRRARRKNIAATVTLSLDIDERGNVARTQVVSIQTSRYKDKFIRAARRAAMGSKFHPKTIGGRPVASHGYLRKYTFDAGD